VLSGAGGDDLFDGDPAELASLVFRHPARAVERGRTLMVPWQASGRARARDFLVRPLLSPLVPRALRRARRRRLHERSFPWAGPRLRGFIASVSEAPAASGAGDRRWGSRPRTPRERYEALARSPQLNEVATMRVQFEVASGIARADPFLDPRLLAFVACVPPLALLHENRMRGLFRESARGLVPESVRTRGDKAAFEAAQAEMVRAAGGFDALRPLATARVAADLGLVEPAPVRTAFEALARDPMRGDWLGVWPVLAVEAFLRSREGVD
jgi:hypothetical protein